VPIIASPSTSLANLATTTVADIITAVNRDLQERFDTGPASDLLIDYTDRIQKQILGHRRWDWLLSTRQRFITERGQTEYWIGPSGSEDVGMVDTGLDLSDVRQVKVGHVYNRSAWTELFPVAELPNQAGWQNPDASYTEGPPVQYRNDRLSPNLISMAPAPDEGDDYEIVPAAPHSTTATGGALSARTYFLSVTFVDEAGNESAPSETARQWVAASKLLTVQPPQPELTVGSAGVTYTSYNVYASETEGSETLQNVSPVAITTTWTEDAAGLTTNGATLPTESEIEPIRGYLIEFRHYRQHTPLISTDSVILIPDDFKDVVVAGVNHLAAQYLHRTDSARDPIPEVQFWAGAYQEGLQRLTKDQNPFPAGGAFIRPDSSYNFNSWW